MAAVVSFVAIVGVALLITLLARRAKGRSRRKIPLFTVMVVGSQESGKSVFVATAFNEMRSPDANGIALTTTPENNARLAAMYQQIADPARGFPPGTPLAGTDFPFAVTVREGSDAFEVIRFAYPEYAGEWVHRIFTEATPEAEDFRKKIQSADVLVGFIDGQKVRNCLSGGDEHKLRAELRDVITAMSIGTCPVHFVLTKWDLLASPGSRGGEFDRVVDFLQSIDFFRNFVEVLAKTGRTVRLIPVSSLGMSFVEDVGGAMRKRPGAAVEPYLIRTALACALVDLMEFDISRPSARRRTRGTTVLDALLSLPLSLSFGPLTVSTEGFALRPTRGETEADEKRRQAVDRVHLYLRRTINQFQLDFPRSDLGTIGTGPRLYD